MVRRAPASSDADDDDVPPAEAYTRRRPIRESARDAHKGPNKRSSTKLAKKVAPSKYPPPDIALNTSEDEVPPSRGRLWKRESATSFERVSNVDEQDDEQDDEQEEVPASPHKSQSGRPKGKDKAGGHRGSEEEDSNSEDEEKMDEDESSSSSGSSGLKRLERNDPSALEAKFDSEAPAWVDGLDDIFDGDHSSPSPPASPRAVSRTPDADVALKASKPKRPRADSYENEKDAHPRSSPAKKKPKAAMSEEDVGSAEDDAGSKLKEKERDAEDAEDRKRERKREQERKRKREREREAEREQKKEQVREDRAKERAKERERRRRELEEYQEQEAARDREEERERKREADRERMKQRERDNERKRQEAFSREMERGREMEREYEHEHEMLRKQLRAGFEKGKDRGHKRHGREHEEVSDEHDHARGSSHPKTKSTPGSPPMARHSRPSPTSKAASSSKTRVMPSRSTSKTALKKLAGPTSSSNKRKRSKQDEEITFISDKGSGSSDKEPPSQRRRRRVEDQSALSNDSDDTSVDIVWFGNSRPNLTDQHPRVKQVANLAIADCELSVCTVNAFPDDPDEDDSFTRNILIKHAKALGYKVMTKMLKDKKDNMYWKKLSTIPAQRVYLLRGKVKSKCESAVRAAYGLTVGDSEKVSWLEKDLAYIFPHNYENRTVIGKEGYKPAIFENMLTASFFSRRQSYGYRISKHFISSHPDKPDEKEIPAAMLALVSTAIFAAIDDFKQAHYDAAKFEVNPNLHVYRRNIAFLDHIKDKNIDAYHVLMHGLFKRVTGNSGGGSNVGHGIGYLDVDGMERA